MKYALATTGLSLTQAQSISNLLNQRAVDIAQELSAINNSTKTLSYQGQTLTGQVGHAMPANILSLIKEKSELHATQAFLMENIKHKDVLLRELQRKEFAFDGERPQLPAYKTAVVLPAVTEDWAWNQLTPSQYAEYLEQEALASHAGQFIHKGGKLDVLRKELANTTPLEWMVINQGTVNSSQIPVTVSVHHTPAQLLDVHTQLAALHRQYEQRVNYFKALVKNKVTEENARIARVNGEAAALAATENEQLRTTYNQEVAVFNEQYTAAANAFEEQRQGDIQTTAALRIAVDPRFQPVIDAYLALLTVESAS